MHINTRNAMVGAEKLLISSIIWAGMQQLGAELVPLLTKLINITINIRVRLTTQIY
jgi:hypothetical protein